MFEHDLSASIVTPSGLNESEIAAWEHLSRTVSDLSSPFLSVHYARAVADVGVDVRVCVIRQQGVIRGFLPYQFRNRLGAWSKTAEPVGDAMTDYFGLIAEPGFHVAPVRLLQLAHLNTLVFSHLDEPQLRYGLTGEQPRIGLRIRLAPRLEAEAPISQDVARSLSHKYVKDTERRMRQLSKEIGPIDFVFDVRSNKRELLEQLIMHKRSQYARTNVPDALQHPWKSRLLHSLSECSFDTCRGLLSTLSANGHWIAMHFGIVGNGMLQYWLPVYNPEFSRYAPGRLLIQHIIQAAHTAAIHTIDRGEGDTPAKRELANEEHRFFRGLWHNQSMTSRVTRGCQSIKWRLGI